MRPARGGAGLGGGAGKIALCDPVSVTQSVPAASHAAHRSCLLTKAGGGARRTCLSLFLSVSVSLSLSMLACAAHPELTLPMWTKHGFHATAKLLPEAVPGYRDAVAAGRVKDVARIDYDGVSEVRVHKRCALAAAAPPHHHPPVGRTGVRAKRPRVHPRPLGFARCLGANTAWRRRPSSSGGLKSRGFRSSSKTA